MKRHLALSLAAVCVVLPAFAEEVTLNISWSFDPKIEVYTRDQTQISFPKSIAGFDQKRATPANEDGSASFA